MAAGTEPCDLNLGWLPQSFLYPSGAQAAGIWQHGQLVFGLIQNPYKKVCAYGRYDELGRLLFGRIIKPKVLLQGHFDDQEKLHGHGFRSSNNGSLTVGNFDHGTPNGTIYWKSADSKRYVRQ